VLTPEEPTLMSGLLAREDGDEEMLYAKSGKLLLNRRRDVFCGDVDETLFLGVDRTL